MKEKSVLGIIKKIALILCILVICCFLVPKTVNASSWIKNAGGTLIDLVMRLFIFLGDSILNLLQSNFISTDDIIIQANASSVSSWDTVGLLKIALGLLLVFAAVAISISTVGAGLPGVMAGIKVVGGIILAAGGGTILAVSGVNDNISSLSGNFDLPMIRFTPFEIFSGQISVFDINFIEPEPSKYSTITIKENADYDSAYKWDSFGDYLNKSLNWEGDEDFKDLVNAINATNYEWKTVASGTTYHTTSDAAIGTMIIEDGKNWVQMKTYGETSWVETSPGWGIDNSTSEYIFYNRTIYHFVGIDKLGWTNEWKLTKVNLDDFIKEMEAVRQEDGTLNINTKEYKSTASILQDSISTWYKVLRTVALVGLLSVLIYIGIRILLTATATDKAKYKKMLIDWVVAICILFILHYLMVFMLTISSSITKIFMNNAEENIFVALPTGTSVGGEQLPVSGDTSGEFANKPLWSTSFTGYVRLLAGAYNDNASSENLAYGIIYIVMVIYTIIFTVMYLKRAIYMAFLTMIAPLIALTYPLDKIKDGKAQAFGLWIREYIFNCLMQPLHLALYTMIVSNVMEYVKDHPVYALVAIGFLLPAEQFIRKMFGFEKSDTIGALGNMAGGAALMGGIKKLSRLNKRRPPENDDLKEKPVRTQEQGGYSLPDVEQSMNNVMRNSKSTQNVQNMQEYGKVDKHEVAQSLNKNIDDSKVRINNIMNSITDVQNMQEYGKIDKQEIAQISNKNIDNSKVRINNVMSSATDVQNMQEYGKIDKQEIAQISNKNIDNSKVKINNIMNSTKDVHNAQSTFVNQKSNKINMSTWSRLVAGTNSVGEHYRQRVIKAKPLKTIGRFTAKGMGGIALGTIGLAAGIATGNPSNVLSYTMAATGIGATLGGTTMDNIMDEAHDIKENFAKGYNGEQVYMNDKSDKMFFASKEFQSIINDHTIYSNLLQGMLEQEQRVELIKDEIMQYRKSGISDIKKIKKAMKLKLSPKQGAYAIKLSEKIGKSGWNNESTRIRYYNDYFAAISDEIGEDEAKKIWNIIPKLLF